MTNKKKKPSASGMERIIIQRDKRGTMAVRGRIAERRVAMARRKNPRP
jgi:hypothetical protein